MGRVNLEELYQEFGDPSFRTPKIKVGTFEDGVECPINRTCKKVNKCDVSKCPYLEVSPIAYGGFIED